MTKFRESAFRHSQTSFENRKKNAPIIIPLKLKRRKEQSTWRKYFGVFLYLFHPATICSMLMVGLLAWYLRHILLRFPRSSSAARIIPKSNLYIPQSNDSMKVVSNRTIILNPEATQKNEKKRRRVKRHDEQGDGNHEGRSAREEDNRARPRPKRPIPDSPLDDMLLDAEMPPAAINCLPDKNVELLENLEKEARTTRATLSEHLEDCTSNDDCMQLSPYHWKTEGMSDVCRKRTFLNCNVKEGKCMCQDRFDPRWDTEVAQSSYQWNPITKTCYVRATNPCKNEVPCAPGTTCRATVSISYNVPALERICDCTNITLIVRGLNGKWWYCAEYWQQVWYYDLDNIKKMDHPVYHVYARMREEENLNATAEEPTDYDAKSYA